MGLLDAARGTGAGADGSMVRDPPRRRGGEAAAFAPDGRALFGDHGGSLQPDTPGDPSAARMARRRIAHDPEKWVPVFPKRSCSNKKIERDDDSKKSHPALGPWRASLRRSQLDTVTGIDPRDSAIRQQRLDRRIDTLSQLVVGAEQPGRDVPVQIRIVVERRNQAQRLVGVLLVEPADCRW